MKEWEVVVRKFLEDYQKNAYFEGAILSGSYVIGSNSEYSDINILIVNSDKETFSEVGVVVIDGYTISYMISTKSDYLKRFDEEFKTGKLKLINMFRAGKVMEDKRGESFILKDRASDYSINDFPGMTDEDLQAKKYKNWIIYNELKSSYIQNRPVFDYIFYQLMEELINLYFEYNKMPFIPLVKLDKFLKDAKYRKSYGLKKWFGPKTAEAVMACLNAKQRHEKNQDIDVLYSMITSSLGGFEVGEYKQRSKLNGKY